MSGEGLTASIEEVAAIDFLRDLADDYRQRHCRSPIQISHWDPSDGFTRAFASKLLIPELGEPFHYRYSFESDARTGVLRKLGYTAPSRRILLTENGTNAVLAVANALALIGVRRVALLSPSYFATSYALERFGLTVRRVYWGREDGSFTTPQFELGEDEALWAESPIFGTGVSADERLGSILTGLVTTGRVVVYDRSLEPDAGELGANLETAKYYLSIHAPHKTICVNGLKFGAATFHEDLYDAFDHWADVLSGGLSLSAEVATRHFVSPAFNSYAEAASIHVASAMAPIQNLVKTFAPTVESDVMAAGYWRTLYAPEVPAELGKDRAWIAELVDRTGAVPIPGIWTGCSPAWGFCFRVNLLRYDGQFRAALHRMLTALTGGLRTSPTR